MSLFTNETGACSTTIDPFADPVSYLAGLGIEAELVEVRGGAADAA